MRRLLLLLVVACTKKEAAPPPSVDDAGLLPLQPLPEDPAPAPTLSTAPGRQFPVAPGARVYEDSMDLRVEEVDGGCAPGDKPVSVRVEIVKRGQAVDLVTMGTRRRITWKDPIGDTFTHCRASHGGDEITFGCVTDEGSIPGKVYLRRNVLVVSTNASDDGRVVHATIPLPCGSKARFEHPSCPALANCRSLDGGSGCECLPVGMSFSPIPAPTTRPAPSR